jgi:hypothetical protein
MPAEQVRKIQAHVAAQVEHQSAGRAADVAGALASLVRATDPTDPRYDALREAYGVALETAGLVPGDGRWTCRKCGGRLSSCVACGDPAHCGDVYCDTHDETTANAT